MWGFFALYMYFSKDLGTGNLSIGNQLTDELLVTVYQIVENLHLYSQMYCGYSDLQKIQLGDLPGDLTDFSN